MSLPLLYDELFADLATPTDSRQSYLVSLADSASRELIPTLITKAEEICGAAGVPRRDADAIDRIYASFRLVTPGSKAPSLGDILNAAWRAFHDEKLWADVKHLNAKDLLLRELVLKSIEVFEVEQMPALK